MIHPAILDHVFAALLVVGPLIEWRWGWPRFLARLSAGVPGVRLRFYVATLLAEWLPALALLVFWDWKLRSWSALHFAGGSPWRTALTLVAIVVLIVLQTLQRRAILASTKRIERIRRMLAFVEPLVPHTGAERRVFWAVSVTAGVCEEIFYRGFLTWYLSLWMPLVAAVLLSALLFGFGHIYLGRRQVPQTALVGLLLSLVVLFSGSLWPAVLLHASIDWNSGELGYRVLGQAQPAAAEG